MCTLTSVADPDPGSSAFLAPGSGIQDAKISRSRSGMNILDHIFESLEKFFWAENS
jgi:hypothetical protein